ncbi:MAG: hypothetical protein AAGF77_01635 [Bacteroidota bacterium]
MKKWLKFLLVAFGVCIAILITLLLWLHEPLPKGKAGTEAEALALKMLNALQYEKYLQTRYLEWSYQNGRNHYVWDKAKGKCKVTWSRYQVDLDLMDTKNSKATEEGKVLSGKQLDKAVTKAQAFFNNDSFWLVAPYKVMDEGTSRSLVPLENGQQGLLVTYNQGGTTPGDSYLWLLNKEAMPTAYKMWVKILPIGGIPASWEDWQVMESGVLLPEGHHLGPLYLSMGDIKGYN